MQYSDEKDYLMRIIKEAVRIMFSLMLGKKYVQVELPEENKYIVSGKKFEEYKAMIDRGKVNEAENILLENIDYGNKEEVTAAVYFYQYLSEKGEEFLKQNNYSQEEALEGLKALAEKAGYQEVFHLIED